MDIPQCSSHNPHDPRLDLTRGLSPVDKDNTHSPWCTPFDKSPPATQSPPPKPLTTKQNKPLPSPPSSTDELSILKSRKRKRETDQFSSPKEVVILEYIEEELARKPWKRRAVEEKRARGKGDWPGRGRSSRSWGDPDRLPTTYPAERSSPFRDIYSEMNAWTPSRGTSLTSLTSQTRFPAQDQCQGSQSRSPSPSRRALYTLGRASPSVHLVSQDESVWTKGALELHDILLERSSWVGVIPGKLRVSQICI